MAKNDSEIKPRNKVMALFSFLENSIERFILLSLYTFIVFSIGIEVIRRFVFSFSSIWGEEMARYIFIYLVWFGAAIAVKNKNHIRIDVLVSMLEEKKKLWFQLFSELITLAFAILVFYLSIESLAISIQFGSVTDGLRISKAWFLFSIPLGFSLISIHIIRRIYITVMAIRGHNLEKNEDNSLFN